ncbi:DUF5320 domain-containing protein [Holophaga foetida]|uniref:DUF5320 domain-containing protein n=1 Tax=Holophaga foetida TaxID=35839 RepID=UPI0002475043|nr:DUF5320 domain-containing protein [Holophaga foetida]
MPNRNGSGPMGAGPRTGRGLGRCAPGAEALPQGRGTGRGGGRGRCGRFFGRRAFDETGGPTAGDSVSMLEREAQELEARLSDLRQRLDTLKGPGERS